MKNLPVKLLIGLLAIYLLSGCVAAPKDTLVILHPHSSDFASHVIDGFKEWYKEETGNEITVDTIEKYSGDCWTDVSTWNGTSPEADVWWGGGEFYFEQARSAELLVRYEVAEDANIKANLGGWHLKDDSDTTKAPMWYAAAISGFGIIYNEEYLDTEGLEIPETWEDLIDYSYYGHISMCDPAESGSTLAAVKQVLQLMSDATDEVTYETNVTEGWQYWLQLSGNVGTFTTSSSAVPAAVAEGNAGVGICIDYYALDKMLTDDNIGFTYGGGTTVSPDPAGILKGAANLDAAKKFMDYLIGTEGQTLVGDYRTPANFKADTADHVPKAFDSTGKATTEFPAITPFSPSLDGAIHSRVEAVYNNYIVQNHAKAKAAWDAIGKQTNTATQAAALAIYTKLPSDCNGTIAGFRDLNYKDTTTINNWKTEGTTNFDAAKDAATD
ncbi:MAG: ABC transporter substrate-binding protein [Promethearchaeota archaeon]